MSVPQVEKLTVNYRTHNGILGCAANIVDVLLSIFPNSVDRLARDRGHFNGPKPQLLTETATDDLAILLVGSDRVHSQIEFGAHQAVLVRNQAAKDALPDEFDGALVLTIFEAKGLEFDDVFILASDIVGCGCTVLMSSCPVVSSLRIATISAIISVTFAPIR